jgi:hypothetical protein
MKGTPIGGTKILVCFLENDNATPPRLPSPPYRPQDPKGLVEGQERWDRYALTGAAVSPEAVSERLGSIASDARK